VASPYAKPALKFDEQLARLEQRGMVIQDRDRALTTLSRISYYRLSAYWYPFRTSDTTFADGTTFEAALELYEFDRRLRLVVLDGVERAEILARTSITYELAHARHPFAHTEAQHFDAKFCHREWYEGVVAELGRATEGFLDHYRAKYDGFPRVPIWMASEVMSFGTLSKMYKGMITKDQAAVAKTLRVHQTFARTWLHTLSYVRNVCAHHGRLWNRELAIKPMIPTQLPEWSPVKNNRIYAILCILRHVTTPCHGGATWAERVRDLLHETDGADGQWQRAMMGVPTGWATHAFWR
jgi:abortive infection bacteriophage resistance protein